MPYYGCMQQPKGNGVVLGVIFGLVVVGAVVAGILFFKSESKTQAPATNTNAALQLTCSRDEDCTSYCGTDPSYQPICGVTTIGTEGTCTCRAVTSNANATVNATTNSNANGNANVNASTPAKGGSASGGNTNSTVSTAGWKTYSSSYYGFSFRYPASWDHISDKLPTTTQPPSQWAVSQKLMIGVNNGEGFDVTPTMQLWVDPDGFGPFFPDKIFTIEKSSNGFSITNETNGPGGNQNGPSVYQIEAVEPATVTSKRFLMFFNEQRTAATSWDTTVKQVLSTFTFTK